MLVSGTLALACCLWVLWADATAFEDIETRFSAGIAVTIPAVSWVVLIAIALLRYRNWLKPSLLVPICVVSTLALTMCDIPGRVGWELSQSEMDKYTDDCRTISTSTTGSEYVGKRVGAYTFHRIDRQAGGGCDFQLLRDYPVVRSGFLYRPHGENLDGIHGHTYYAPLGSRWYYYRWIG